MCAYILIFLLFWFVSSPVAPPKPKARRLDVRERRSSKPLSMNLSPFPLPCIPSPFMQFHTRYCRDDNSRAEYIRLADHVKSRRKLIIQRCPSIIHPSTPPHPTHTGQKTGPTHNTHMLYTHPGTSYLLPIRMLSYKGSQFRLRRAIFQAVQCYTYANAHFLRAQISRRLFIRPVSSPTNLGKNGRGEIKTGRRRHGHLCACHTRC